jgi:beta-aspartyl-dipeptidase (metallo-type)
MIKLIQGGEIFAPEERGVQDLLIVGGSIGKMDRNISVQGLPGEVESYDARDKIICPGLVDSHIHLIGGGGAGGYLSRAKEIAVEKVVRHGVTTVVGCLGLDRVSKNVKTLLIKSKALERSGISAYLFTGSWTFPPLTITGTVEEDLLLIDPVIGVKLAVGEPATTHPTERELRDLLAEIRRGAILSGKAGILHVHLGPEGQEWMRTFQKILSAVKLPFHKVVFTHANRSRDILQPATEFLRLGGALDFTVSLNPVERPGSIPAGQALREIVDAGIPWEKVTFSSDSNASRVLPDGKIIYIGIERLLFQVRDLVREQKMPISSALRPATINAAKLYQIDSRKGSLHPGKDADLLILNNRWEVSEVMAKGCWVVRNGQALVSDPV